jgi:hypothetical protein
MSEPPERPAQPGVETHVAKEIVADLQAAVDATLNATNDAAPDEVEQRLRAEIEDRGLLGRVPEAWITQAVGPLAAGEPVAVEPGDA